MDNNHICDESPSLQVCQSYCLDKSSGPSNQGNNRGSRESSVLPSDSNHPQKYTQAENHPWDEEGGFVSEIKDFPYNRDNFKSPTDPSRPSGLSKAFLDALGKHNKITTGRK